MSFSSVPNISGSAAAAGGATAANQVTGNASLASIDTKLTAPLSVNQATSSTAALTSVLNAVASFAILGVNASRKGLFLYNDSTTTTNVAFAATASATAFTLVLTAKSSYIMDAPIYLGAISGIAAVANGSIRITELT